VLCTVALSIFPARFILECRLDVYGHARSTSSCQYLKNPATAVCCTCPGCWLIPSFFVLNNVPEIGFLFILIIMLYVGLSLLLGGVRGGCMLKSLRSHYDTVFVNVKINSLSRISCEKIIFTVVQEQLMLRVKVQSMHSSTILLKCVEVVKEAERK
jgi:hypothetical protein